MLYDPQRMQTASRRKRIWELDDLQCPVIGTCLGLGELRKLARKADIQVPRNVSDFELHGMMVSVCKRRDHASRLVSKHLDRKYAAAVRRYGKCKDTGAVREQWRADKEAGDIPGPFWAVATHPATGPELLGEVFGEVHMLSHLVGAANRADIRKLTDLERENERLRLELRGVKRTMADRVRSLRDEKNRLARRVGELTRELRWERCKTARYETSGGGGGALVHEMEAEALRRELDSLRSEFESLSGRLDAETRRTELLRAEKRELESEKQVLEGEVARLLAPADCPAGRDAPCPALCGRRILYVGGRTGLLPQYRSLVESYGGSLIHHDGGQEDSSGKLEGCLARADAVVCPVDCVSHEACQAVKAFCKRTLKPCYMMRTSGVSSLAKTLTSLPEQTDGEGSTSGVVRGG
ncbi:DUF2325 domain-containing protein [Desulfohalovibrio reitneri]|uniref:DUF2325 domain-containing protein n=1 Tax=Desulfohalovibrio reitneri TaxID=1307759 RepID=UPI0004A758F4|nr:DUF2325 domain-containing protein [Desulfohalovibrio reitneri]